MGAAVARGVLLVLQQMMKRREGENGLRGVAVTRISQLTTYLTGGSKFETT